MKKKVAESIEKTGAWFIVLRESVASFVKNNDFGAAASLAYYGLFALIPLFLLAIYLLSHYIFSSQRAFIELELLSRQLFPNASSLIMQEVNSLFMHGDIWGATSIIALLWVITPLVIAVRNEFTRILRISGKQALIASKLRDAVAVLFLLSLFLFLVITQLYYSQVIKALLKKLPVLFSVSNFLAPLCLTTLVLSVFYFVFSPVRLRFAHVIPGSLMASLFLILMRPAFSSLVTFNPKFGFAFGSLKTIFIVLLWVYCSFSVILFGAELIANVRKRDVIFIKKLFAGKIPREGTIKTHLESLIRRYEADEVIIDEGGAGDYMFFILSGWVKISKKGQFLKLLKKGDYFGEMAMLLGTPRNATAAAVEKTVLLLISQENFETLLREEPEIVISILKEMAFRLSAVSEML